MESALLPDFFLQATENAHAPVGGLAPLQLSKEASISFRDDAGIDIVLVSLSTPGVHNFYGATVNGGMYGNGVVFEMTPAGAFTDLHDFDPNTEGGEPFSALIEGTNGVLYGTTAYGGTYNVGTIYSIPLGGGNPDTLYSFDGTSVYIPGGTADAAYERTFLWELRMGWQR
jgi:uncharacterized repeat protein (TIGR03803 family)